jgi:hypothetical protein
MDKRFDTDSFFRHFVIRFTLYLQHVELSDQGLQVFIPDTCKINTSTLPKTWNGFYIKYFREEQKNIDARQSAILAGCYQNH